MNILLIEDDVAKRKSIEHVIRNWNKVTVKNLHIEYASNLLESRRQLWSNQFDLIIFDMYLPENSDNKNERDCSEELIIEYSKSKNYKTEAITLTQVNISNPGEIQSFNIAGITVVKYDNKNNWVNALHQKLERASQQLKYDFLVFCALSKERNAFKETDSKIGEKRKISGIDCLEVSIESANGLIIKPQRAGLVNMAIVASKAIELFQPKIVAMSGICAGVEGEVNYLDLIVGSTCWEYQTGKWKDGVFKQEPYHADLEHGINIDLEHSTENSAVINSVRKGLFLTELQNFKIILAPISSGSAVIADREMMETIGIQHRKMAALEMEMYALYEAAKQSLCKPLYFGAKAVVDMGTASKGDYYHEPASIISARYVSLMLRQKLIEISAESINA